MANRLAPLRKTLDMEVTYSIDRLGGFSVDYRASTDRTTVVNPTQHAYWNLTGHGDVTHVQIPVSSATLMPSWQAGR
ncbi:hypothetical protein ACPA54_30445 [Uniformispora flossi]|uniref:aldose epimerase family protein n=1 Tax=Uniformispora flossi TaxID=3390723 RepID=UPI003C2E7C32